MSANPRTMALDSTILSPKVPYGYATTRTGLVIGIAHQPRPQPLGSQAEAIQAALLRPQRERSFVLGSTISTLSPQDRATLSARAAGDQATRRALRAAVRAERGWSGRCAAMMRAIARVFTVPRAGRKDR